MSVAADLEMTIEQFDEFLEFLIDENSCSLLMIEGGKITTNDIQNVFENVMIEREKSRSRKSNKTFKPGMKFGVKMESSPELSENPPENEKVMRESNTKEKKEKEKKEKKEKEKKVNQSLTAGAEVKKISNKILDLAEMQIRGVAFSDEIFQRKHGVEKGKPLNSALLKIRDSWAADIDKLNRLDKVTEQEIAEIIRWIYGAHTANAEFWRAVVQSGSKLRLQFSKLVAKYKEDRKSVQENSIPDYSREQ